MTSYRSSDYPRTRSYYSITKNSTIVTKDYEYDAGGRVRFTCPGQNPGEHTLIIVTVQSRGRSRETVGETNDLYTLNVYSVTEPVHNGPPRVYNNVCECLLSRISTAPSTNNTRNPPNPPAKSNTKNKKTDASGPKQTGPKKENPSGGKGSRPSTPNSAKA